MNIYINGQKIDCIATMLSYEEIVVLAGFKEGRHPTVVYYSRRSSDTVRSGTMCKGRVIDIEEGMQFEVADTSNA